MFAKFMTFLLFLWGVLLSTVGIALSAWPVLATAFQLPSVPADSAGPLWALPVAGILAIVAGAALTLVSVILALRMGRSKVPRG